MSLSYRKSDVLARHVVHTFVIRSSGLLGRTMWKASAVRAREPTRKPLMSSRRKKQVSMTIMILMRRLFDQAIRSGLPMMKAGGRRRPPLSKSLLKTKERKYMGGAEGRGDQGAVAFNEASVCDV